MLTLDHFHTKHREPLATQHTIKNCLAEYLFPETAFSLGVVYGRGTQPEDLRPYLGQRLQFSSGERMYFASSDVGELLYPVPSDRTAYGSLPFTPCLSLQEVTARVLIVDDENGFNGGLFPEDWAKRRVGDCFGRISHTLCDDLTGQSQRPFQFRIGIKPQSQCPVYRIAKGTLAPTDLQRLVPEMPVEVGKNARGDIKVQAGFDLILPTSSFKGRKGEEGIQPGMYQLTLGIGVKTLAQYRDHSLGTQVLVNYPKAVQQEFLPLLEGKATELASVQQDISELAQYYVSTFEQRFQMQDGVLEDWDDLGDMAAAIDRALGKGSLDAEKRDDVLLYHLLKEDLAHHRQLLEHPKVVETLRQFVRRRWLDLATGRAIKFQSGLAQPSLNLAEDEVCIPILPDGREVIVSRSPLLNSNGVIVLTNRHIREARDQEGVVYINPDAAARHLQADFDGDFLFFAEASDYPVLTAEIGEAHLPQNRYPDVVKQEKVPYTGTFEEVAAAAQVNQIGIIANQIQRLIALRWECSFLENRERKEYLAAVQHHYQKLKSEVIPPQFQERWRHLCGLPTHPSEAQEKAALADVESILFDVVGELSNQLQIAADGPKSSQRPNKAVLDYCTALSKCRVVGWIAEKKKPEVYLNRSMKSCNNSSIDWMIAQTNGFYQRCSLTPQALVTFRDLFKGVDYTDYDSDVAELIKGTYNEYAANACRLELKAREREEPVLLATSVKSQRTIVIEKLLDYAHQNQDIWQRDRLNIKLVEHSKSRDRLLAVSFSNKKPYPIGMVSLASQQEHSLRPGLKLTNAKVEIDHGVTQMEVKAAFQKLSDYVDLVRESVADKDKESVAAALWYLSHPRKDDGKLQSGKANAVLAIFPEQVMERLDARHLDQLKVVGIHQPTNEHGNRFWQGEEALIVVQEERNPESPLYQKRVVEVNGQTFAPLAHDSVHLLVGTVGQGCIFTQPGAKVTATSRKGNTLTLKKAGHYGYQPWQGEEKTVSLHYVMENEQPTWVLSCEGNPVGELDKESLAKLSRRKLLKEGQTFTLSLQSSPATTAFINLLPETLHYLGQDSAVAFYLENNGGEGVEK